MNWTPRSIALSLAALSAGLLLRAEANNKIPVPAPPVQVGQVNFSTSCSAQARPAIETGVALLHSFQYLQADQSFSEAAKRDPKCAIAYWGKAMSHYEQLWEFPSGKALKLGAQDIQRAQTLGAPTERERAYIAAAAAFYLADAKVSETQRVQAFSAALAALHKQSPDDVNAAAFYALSLLALADQQEVDAQANRKAAIAILEPLCRKAPDNPGPAHYLIHATDTAEFAPQGLDAARAYSKIAPDSSHALHMPSHIFVRLGLWQESISSNIAGRQQVILKAVPGNMQIAHFGRPKRQRPCFIQQDRVDLGELFEIQAAFDDRSLMRCSADAPEDRKRCPGRDSTRPCHDNHGDCGANVVRKQESHDGGAHGEVYEVSCEAVGNTLNGCARLLGFFNSANDFSEGCVAAQTLRANFQSTRLVDRSGIHLRAGIFLHRHRFASDGGLVNKRVATHHQAIYRDSASRPDEDDCPDRNFLNSDVFPRPSFIHRHRRRQQVNQVTNCRSAPAHCQALEHFGNQNEERDNQRGEHFADSQGGQNRDGHGEFHRHSALDNIFNCFVKYGIAANEGTSDAGKHERETQVRTYQPRRSRGHADENDSSDFQPVRAMRLLRSFLYGAGISSLVSRL